MREAGKKGYGMFAKHHVFTVENGQLVPVKYPDPQKLSELTGYEKEREKVIANTSALLAGSPANNVLPYGDAGTGKSSTVKAIANEYAADGLRLVEVKKNPLYKLPALLDQLAAGEIPLRVTHNDTKINNVLIDAATGKGICVIDLDTVMPGLAVNDFGDSIRTGANDCAEDEPDQSKGHFDLHLYEVFAKGYLSTAGASMSMAEKQSLAWGARLMTLECGIRFLTDYLEGDHYFHIARPDHNLARARTQFTLVRQMEEVFDQMLEIVCPDNH